LTILNKSTNVSQVHAVYNGLHDPSSPRFTELLTTYKDSLAGKNAKELIKITKEYLKENKKTETNEN
jgi:hypothetical protein